MLEFALRQPFVQMYWLQKNKMAIMQNEDFQMVIQKPTGTVCPYSLWSQMLIERLMEHHVRATFSHGALQRMKKYNEYHVALLLQASRLF